MREVIAFVIYYFYEKNASDPNFKCVFLEICFRVTILDLVRDLYCWVCVGVDRCNVPNTSSCLLETFCAQNEIRHEHRNGGTFLWVPFD